MATICPIAIPRECTELLKGYSDYDPSKYSEKLKETLAIECFEERILALHTLYKNYEKATTRLYAICFSNICDGKTSDKIEEEKKELKKIISENNVIGKNIEEMLDKYNEVEFPEYDDDPVSMVSFLIRKKLISKHT